MLLGQNGLDIDDIEKEKGDRWRWYVIRTSKVIPQAWLFIINCLTIYAMFFTPFM
jgi:hypothetical protein